MSACPGCGKRLVTDGYGGQIHESTGQYGCASRTRCADPRPYYRRDRDIEQELQAAGPLRAVRRGDER